MTPVHINRNPRDRSIAGRPARVLLLTHYFAPELGAPQTRLRETTRVLRELDHEVRIVTGPPHYPDGRVRLGYGHLRPRREIIDGGQVLRLPMLPRPNRGFVDRAIDQGTFAIAAAAAVSEARWADVILVESPPLFLGATATWLRRVTSRPYLYHVADPWPDFPVAMGLLGNPAARRIAYALEALAYRNAGLITTVSPGLVDLLDAKASATGRVRLLPNGVTVSRFDREPDAAATRRILGWPEARFTIAYVGTIGLAQGVRTLLDAVAPLAAEGIQVRLIGEGADREQLRHEAFARGLDHVHFDEPVASEQIPGLLSAADALIVMLRDGPLFDLSLPTKLVEGLAAGRPIVASAGGDTARLVATGGIGVSVHPEDPGALREAILTIADSGDRAAMGRRARIIAEQQFDRAVIVARLSEYLQEVADSA